MAESRCNMSRLFETAGADDGTAKGTDTSGPVFGTHTTSFGLSLPRPPLPCVCTSTAVPPAPALNLPLLTGAGAPPMPPTLGVPSDSVYDNIPTQCHDIFVTVTLAMFPQSLCAVSLARRTLRDSLLHFSGVQLRHPVVEWLLVKVPPLSSGS